MTNASPLKNARVELRVTADQKRSIEEAAAVEGRTVTDFSTTTLVAHAHDVLQRDRQARMDAARFDAFVDIMDQPARTVEGLRDLMGRRPVFVD